MEAPQLEAKRDSIEQLVEDAVRAGLRTPLRDPIMEAVSEEVEEQESDPAVVEVDDIDTAGKSTSKKALQGLAVFVLMFAALYVTLKRLTGDDSS